MSANRGDHLKPLAYAAVIITIVGGGIFTTIAANNSRAIAEIQIGIELLLQIVGAVFILIGLFGQVSAAIAGRSVANILNSTLLLAAGLAVYTRNLWAILALVLVAGLIVLHSRNVEEPPREDA
jgi:general stress protein CsbA